LNKDDVSRWIASALLSGVFGLAVGLGRMGFWDLVYLAEVPILHELDFLVSLGIGGLIGSFWGLLTGLPRKWWQGALLNSIGVGIAFHLWVCYGSTDYHYLRSPSYPQLLTLIVCLSSFLSTVFRGLIRPVGFAPVQWGKYSIAVLLVILLGLGLTWVRDQLSEHVSRRRAELVEVHQYCQSQGWENYTLELMRLDSMYVIVGVLTDSGEMLTCTTYIGRNEVTCQP
jgi:hypothetical protein